MHTIIKQTRNLTMDWVISRDKGVVSYIHKRNGHTLQVICDDNITIIDDGKVTNFAIEVRLQLCQALNKYMEAIQQDNDTQ